MNQDYQDRIDQYLLGRMQDDERQAFEQELEEDLDLKEQFEFTKKVKDVIAGRNRRLAQIREWKKDYEAKIEAANTHEETKPRASKLRYVYWISSIAAIFIVGIFVFSPVFYETAENPRSSVYVNYSGVREGDDFSDIAQKINEGKYDSALVRIEEELKKLEAEKLLTEQERPNMDDEEYSYLQRMNKIQTDELNLLKAYAFLGQKRKEEAMAILDALRHQDSEFKMQADSLHNLYK